MASFLPSDLGHRRAIPGSGNMSFSLRCDPQHHSDSDVAGTAVAADVPPEVDLIKRAKRRGSFDDRPNLDTRRRGSLSNPIFKLAFTIKEYHSQLRHSMHVLRKHARLSRVTLIWNISLPHSHALDQSSPFRMLPLRPSTTAPQRFSCRSIVQEPFYMMSSHDVLFVS